MKKAKIILALVLAIVMLGATPVSAAECCSPESITIEVGESITAAYVLPSERDIGDYDLMIYGYSDSLMTLKAIVSPGCDCCDSCACQEVYWYSSNPQFLTVDENGLLQVLEWGEEVIITARSAIDNEVFATFSIWVECPE